MRYNDTHKIVRADGTEVRPGDTVTNFRGVDAIFRMITRVPGDGTATTGKILVDEPDWPGAERYAHVYGTRVVERDEHPADCLYCAAGEPMQHNYEPPNA